MSFAESFKEAQKEYNFGGRRFIGQEEYPLKCVAVGKPIWGTARYARNGYVAATEEEGGKFRFAVNVWDGSGCRLFEGSKKLFGALNKLDCTDGLSNIWIELGREGDGQQAPYYVKKIGELTEEEKKAATSAEQVDLKSNVGWYDEF